MNKKILIVEDDQDILVSMQEIMEMQGYEIGIAENGQRALNYLRSTVDLPDLILLDYMMPILDGAGFRAEQKKDERVALIPIVLMTADSNAEIKGQLMGAVFAVKKPLDLDPFLLLIKDYFDGCQTPLL